MSIEWIGFNDGYGIVSYGWVCPVCGEYHKFGEYWEDVVTCELCECEFFNTEKPE